MIKFIHTADIHLDSPLHRLDAYEGAPVETLRHATRKAFENLIELSMSEAIDFLLIGGDLFDGDWKDYNTGLFFINQMHRLKEAGIQVYIVSGNHDAASRVTKSLRYPENVTVFPSKTPKTVVLETVGVAIHGQSFPTAAVMENLAVGYPAPVPGLFNIGALHTSVNGREGHEPYAPCKVEDLNNRGYDYWALGHVHQFEIVHEDPLAVFPGCIQGRHIREPGPKGCVLVTADPGRPVTVEMRTLDVLRWEQVVVDISSCDTRDACLDLFQDRLTEVLKRHAPLPVVTRVTFTGTTSAHDGISADPEHWKEEVRSAALSVAGERVWVEKVRIETRPESSGPDEAGIAGPLLDLVRYVDRLSDDPAELKLLAEGLKELSRKLPHEFRQKAEGFQPDRPEWMGALLDQVRAMLVFRLQQEDGAE